MRIANRVAGLPSYLFAEINQRIAAKRTAGYDVISLGAGDPICQRRRTWSSV